jgi:hypothetical protein
LYRAGASGPFTALFGGNSKNGNAISFNSIDLSTGYYSIGVGDDITAGPNAIETPELSDMISLYPNPSNGFVTLHVKNEISQNASLEVVDALGAVVFTEKIGALDTSSSREIDLSNLAEGVFFVIIKDEQNIFAQKIVIHK